MLRTVPLALLQTGYCLIASGVPLVPQTRLLGRRLIMCSLDGYLTPTPTRLKYSKIGQGA